MSDCEYLTFCPHCDCHLPARTFRNHCDKFFNPVNNTWQKKQGDIDDEFDKLLMEIPRDTPSEDEDGDFCNTAEKLSFDAEELLTNEIWEEVGADEVENDFPQNDSLPSVNVRMNSPCRSLNVLMARYLVVLLAYFWISFHVSDNGMEFLLGSLKRFLKIAGASSQWIAGLAIAFPGTLYYFRKEIGLVNDVFVKYVVCPKCHALYEFNKCHHREGTSRVSNKCTFVRLPNHRQQWRRQKCNATLLKEVTLKDENKKLYPHQTYCYKSIIESLRVLVKRSNFTYHCELWRQREVRSVSQVMCDVFDGRVWRDFQVVNDVPFLAAPRNYAFMLNVDWMQPFKHTIYSVGVMYLVLMNLPRSVRFKPENVILVGIIPGPSQPPLNINTYLSPLVDELLILWNDGVQLRHDGSWCIPEMFKACLLCVACNIPASRKVCGFTGHNSAHGCNKCTKTFVTGSVGDKTDFSGFEPCPLRNDIEHRRHVNEVQSKTTHEEQKKAESNYGVRYSELLRLPYFDCIRFTVIDPMHNLFLGTAKHTMETWLNASILTSADLEKVQKKVDEVHVPTNIGRLPGKIAKSFSGFTADQWKNWVTIFSPYALYDILSEDHYRCWLQFVKACKLVCTPMVYLRDVASCHSHLLQFCREFERLYGNLSITPNMHLHTHLCDCIFDYGPVCGFWLFSFERYNGILGDFYTNNKSIELQLMRKFSKDQAVSRLEFPDDLKGHFQPLLEKLRDDDSLNLLHVNRGSVLRLLTLADGVVDIVNELWFDVSNYRFVAPHTLAKFDLDELMYLKEVYKIFFPHVPLFTIPAFYDKYASIECAGEQYGSRFSRLHRSSFILAKWADHYGGNVNLDATDARPGVVLYYVKQNVTIDDQVYMFCFARVQWFQYHPHRFHCGMTDVVPEIWCANLFDCFGASSFVPIQRIRGKFLPAYDKVASENVLFVLPLNRKYHL
ncbi:Hypothetical predicted protein [Paramuricea clavata]|uniref:Uncharacterized protein n=1 Tax=Paramuricea clavata TaxID=317549 RepID=A0A6S7I7P4_PARCT|nr:Hypothetical predicted protein [Paramuricea clavata]